MAIIYMNGENKTNLISDWNIYYSDKYQELQLTCYFPSGKRYTQPLSKCKIEPTRSEPKTLLIRQNKMATEVIEKAITYGDRYTVIYYPDNEKPYVMNTDKIQLVTASNIKNEAIFNYFQQVTEKRVEQANQDNKIITENVLRQLDKITPRADTVLHTYCSLSLTNPKPKLPQHLIYPFGINESQLEAVEKAFSSQISVIEGPPGTGKTQTILNIIANILLQNKTVAILSNNNSAVENVYEKLDKDNLGYLIAKLGSSDKRTAFFGNEQYHHKNLEEHAVELSDITKLVDDLKSHLNTQNQIALLQAQIEEFTIEEKYLTQWQHKHSNIASDILIPTALQHEKITDFMAYLHYLEQRNISFKDRIQLLFNFRILRTTFINDWQKRKILFYKLQQTYYQQQLIEKKTQLKEYQRILEKNQFKSLLARLTDSSMKYLKTHLSQTIDHTLTFTEKDYRQRFIDFTQRFPIIGSSTHSIINSLGQDAVLDYLIIDEASQQDIVPGILALGCAKNVIIVGDRKQLPHVPIKLGIAPPIEYYDCEKYSLLDSIIRLFQDKIPVTLLKEHYRCHPKIIQFCNKQFYDNQLIPMTKSKGKEEDKCALTLITTAEGNHTRNFDNIRELDSFKAVNLPDLREDNTGFIAPYNNQIKLSQEHLPKGIIKATAHKFQGRECDNIIFSTVLDHKLSSQRYLSFVDDSHLINVAVSRAKNKFILVTGNNVFTKNNQSIAALIRYIKYYADSEQIHNSPVISAFDLLYQRYDKSLEVLNSRLRANDSQYKSEQIIAQLLRDILKKEPYKSLVFHQQIYLEQLVSIQNNYFTKRERDFMQHKASCDFVIYFKTGKSPLCVIEVDGDYHNRPEQIERDNVKNTILHKVGIPLLRLKTVESSIEEKIKIFLASSITYEKEQIQPYQN